MKRLLRFIPLLLTALVITACSSSSDESSSGESTTCTPESLATVEAGVLTIATGEPAYYPWVIDDAPESGEGFEAAVAYAVASELGYDQSAVKWVRTSFDAAIAPGPKAFDFNLQQYSITDERKQVVDFSSPYYKSNQAIVSFKGSKIDGVTTLQGLADAKAKLGAAVSTTSLDVIESQLGLKASVFNDNAAAVTALKNKQIDGLVVDLPTAFYLSAVEVPNGIIVGQIDGSDSGDQGFGLLLSKDNSITSCVSGAVDSITNNGTLQAIIDKWLTSSAGAPVLG
ncbi:MAG: amino acid ABC transporter substrate-binding protein [Actinobacteria bacterium]|nr:amino acid ABC transporter substrate-binding protein [Actinomycetota bacterium]